MGIGPALISAGASLLGGLLGGDEGVTPDEQSRLALLGQAQGARQASQVHGFNPLTLLGVSQPMPGIAPQNYMGSAIADAGLLLADGMKAQSAEKKALEAAETENEKLRKKLEQMTIRPKTGGVYAQRGATPTIRQAVITGDFVGPKPLVPVYDPVAGTKLNLDPGVAGRLGISAGQPILAEDREAIYGDLASEVSSVGGIALGAVNRERGPIYGDDGRPLGKPKKPVPDGVVYGDQGFVYGF